MTALRALARVVVAGVAYVVAAVRHWLDVERAFSEMSIGIARRRMEDQQRKARAAGYRGPLDPGGRWLEDLAAGRIDHAGNRLPLPTAPESPSRRRRGTSTNQGV